MLTLELFFGVGQEKVIEKTLPGQLLECRVVLGIVPLSGAGVSIGRTFEVVFALTI